MPEAEVKLIAALLKFYTTAEDGAPNIAAASATGLIKKWFKSDDAFDAEIRDKFLADVEKARAGGYDHWVEACGDKDSPYHVRPLVALAILIDQFSRNLFRKRAAAYTCDPAMQKHVFKVMDKGLIDSSVNGLSRCLLYLPLMHAEDIDIQHKVVALMKAMAKEHEGQEPKEFFTNFVKSAEYHRDKVIEGEGRFKSRDEDRKNP